jgi:Pyruvate/2-oxoglutarate dehydrogenase complex, dihydrolipoamide acyltransferase (E2) component, and related enzymes
MATIVIMPRQGQSVESCIITKWEKAKGDTVKAGDILFSYETDKSSFEEKAMAEGILLEVFANDGDDVPCLDPVCIIGDAGEDISALLPKKEVPAATAAPEQKSAESTVQSSAPVVTEIPTQAADLAKVSPRAKALAEKTGADLVKAVATGPDGRIIERDVNALLDKGFTVSAEKAQEAPVAAPAEMSAPAQEYTDVPLTNIRKVIAKSMHASLSTMAQLTLNSSFDASELQAYRAQLKVKGEDLGLNNITLNDMVLFAVSRALKNHKDLNAHFLDDKMRYFSGVHLGIAVDTDRGLLVPTLFNADKLSLNELSIAAKKIIKDAQAGTISPDKLKGATFTITNLGSLGVESFTPVINPPQTGILGVDTITKRIKEVNGADVTYPAMGLSLTFDHRAVDGAPAAKLLKEICTLLENFRLVLSK